MNPIFLSIFLVFMSTRAFSSEAHKTVVTPHHKGVLSSLNLGIRYSSILQSRGVVLYRDFQIDPVVGAFFFNDKLEYLGDSIGCRDFVFEDIVRLRTKIVAISDKPLFPVNKSVVFDSPKRSESYEWSNKIEIFFPGYNERYNSELNIEYAADFKAHHGRYAEFLFKTKITDFSVPVGQVKLEPNLFGSIGWGDSNHNEFFYGPSARENGLNNISVGIWTVFPEEADRSFPVIFLKYFKTLDRFSRAEYANGRGEGWLFSVIATFGVLE